MKKLLSLLLLLPLGMYAQDAKTDSSAKVMKWEVGFNNSLAFSETGIYDDIYLAGRNSVSIYRNFSGAQIGLLVDGGLMGVGDDWWLSPRAVVNYKMHFRKLYAYGGGTAGYVREQTDNRLYGPLKNGIVMGAQGGVVYGLGKRFGLNLEGSVHIKHMSGIVTVEDPTFSGGSTLSSVKTGYTDMYFPVSLGVRYRF